MWTDERVEQMRSLAGRGLSAGQIANALGGGVSRCAVIGKAQRVGVSLSASRKRIADPMAMRAGETREDAVRRLAAAGSSHVEIAATLGVKAGWVSEFIRRDGAQNDRARAVRLATRSLSQRVDSARLAGKAKSIERTRAKLDAVTAAAKSEPVPLVDLRSCHCRWPLWGAEKPDPRRSLYCGAAAPPGRSYCAEHAARAFTSRLLEEAA